MSDHARHQHPAFAIVSDTDHTAWIAICTILGIPIILVFGVIRYAVRRTVEFGLDDGFAAAATVRSCDMVHGQQELTRHKVLAIVQASVILGASSHGLGRAADQIRAEPMISLQKVLICQ
jgi:hypothetical protein